jgi:hypothetical protein
MSLEELDMPARERYLARLATIPPGKRLLLALEAIDLARTFMEAGIRARHPGITHREVQARVATLLAGPAVARRVYGFVPEGE